MLMPKSEVPQATASRMRGKARRGSSLASAVWFEKTLDPGWITDRQIEAGRIAITRFVGSGRQGGSRIFPDKPVTKKPAETRMVKERGAWSIG
jgi:large subunit ribosomal protein L16